MALFSTLSDNFNSGSTLNATLWDDWGNTSLTTAQLHIDSGPDAWGYYGASSVSTYDLTGNSVYITVVDAGTQSSIYNLYPLELSLDPFSSMYWRIGNGVAYAHTQVNNSYSQLGSGMTHTNGNSYRIREASGTIYFDYKTSTGSWTNYASVSNPFAVTSLYVGVFTEITAPATATVAKLDNFNTSYSTNRYLRATGNWNGAVWSDFSSGPAGSAPAPTASDDVYIEANFTVTLNVNASCNTLTHTNGTLNLSTYTLDVTTNEEVMNFNTGFTSSGTTARTINLGSGVLRIDCSPTDGAALTLTGSNLTFTAGTSLVEFNIGRTSSGNDPTFSTGDKTFNDVFVNFVAGNTLSHTFGIYGSPTFRSLVIQSKNDRAHTVRVENAKTVTVQKLIIVGASTTNRLAVNTNGATQATISVSDSIYGQNVSVGFIDIAGTAPKYLGSNSVKTSDSFNNDVLLQNPPKAETLSDPLTVAPTSNTNWITSGLTAQTDGVGGGGYSLGSGDTMVSSDTYDLVDSEVVYQFRSELAGARNFGVASFTPLNGSFPPTSKNPRAVWYYAYSVYSFTSSNTSTSDSAATYAFVKSKISGSTMTVSTLDAYGTATVRATITLTADELLFLRSARISGQAYVAGPGELFFIGSVGMLPIPPEVTITKSSAYTVPRYLSITKSASYAVSTTTTLTKTAEYIAHPIYTITKGSEYSVLKVGTATRPVEYSVFLDYNITKTADYTTFYLPTVLLPSTYEVSSSPLQKTFMYKVYSSTGTYLDTWDATTVVSDFTIRRQINMVGSEVTLKLARPADDFGEGEDVDYRNRVEVWCIDKEAPNGTLIFTGFISSYEADYSEDYITITVLSYGAEINKWVLEDGSGNTTIAYNSYDPSNIIKDLFNKFTAAGGIVDYDGTSVDLTGTTVSYTFNTYTLRECIDKVLQLAPENWYYYVDDATNTFHFHLLEDTPDHIFSIGKDIADIRLKKDIDPIINTVFFVGGGDPPLYKKYTIPASITAYGIRGIRVKDSRVTLTATAQLIANATLRGDPEILVQLSVIDSNLNDYGYNLESVSIGQTVKIGSSGIGPSSQYDIATYDNAPYDYDLTNLSSIVFQITSLYYVGDLLHFTLATTPPDITKRIQDISRNVIDIQNSDNPVAPS